MRSWLAGGALFEGKRRWWLLTAAGALALVAAACQGDTSVTVAPAEGSGIAASGTGRVTVVPDIVVMNLGVEVTRPRVGEARAAATATMDRVLTSLRSSGVQDRDIQTTGLSIFPQYGPSPDRTPEILGYTVSNSVSVKVRNIDSVSAVLDGVIDSGGDDVRVHGVTFTVDDPERYLGQARERAIEDARRRAEELARLGGVSLGELRAVREASGGGPQPFDASMAQARGGLGGGVSPGEAETVLTVEVTYGIE